jgi:hypothetical protein
MYQGTQSDSRKAGSSRKERRQLRRPSNEQVNECLRAIDGPNAFKGFKNGPLHVVAFTLSLYKQLRKHTVTFFHGSSASSDIVHSG